MARGGLRFGQSTLQVSYIPGYDHWVLIRVNSGYAYCLYHA